MKIERFNASEITYVLTAVFVILKFDGAISWSWWLVFSPLLVLLVFAIIAVWISLRR
jgi:hypothetical protein